MTNNFYLKVFEDKSELIQNGETVTFLEGDMSVEAKNRYRHIQEELENGFLEKLIEDLINNPASSSGAVLGENYTGFIKTMVDSVTSEVGRAIVGLSVLQLVVKSIEPTQSIRLHKGGGGARNFSWQEGISMRSLDNRYITPSLRKYDLLRLNADGFMMTRSLAENYPYSRVYKAQLRGARKEWLEFVEGIESQKIEPLSSLKYLLSLLVNQASDFTKHADETIMSLEDFLRTKPNRDNVERLIWTHINKSDYAARLMEISMHSLMQAMSECGVFVSQDLVPLSQMRSANKKHGNVGDIELIQDSEIIESWDAKYGKSYLRDEIEELAEKLKLHDSVKIAGFVTDSNPERIEEMQTRISEIEELYGVKIELLKYADWVTNQFSRAKDEVDIDGTSLSEKWIRAYTESLAQRRREIAPIDEPCHSWIISLNSILMQK